MRLSGKIFLFSALIVTASATVACKPKTGASIKAIHLADKSISLLPGRLYAPQGSGVAYENSIRMMMLPIGCRPNEIRHLEEMVQRNVESLRHIGPKIVGADGQPIRGAESCAIFTSFAVHPWAYGTLFDGPPRTKESFMKQQWVWLAMRGRTTSNGFGFATGFDRWMNEGGIFANMPQPLVDLKIEHWDRLYNPCQRTDAAKVFGIDKREFFSCVNGDYEPNSDKLGSLLVNMLNESGQDLVMRIRANEFHMYDTNGLEQAIVIQNPQSAVANAKSGAGTVQTGKSASLGLASKTAKWGYRARSAGGSAYQKRTPLFFAGYSAYSNFKRPAPVVTRRGDPVYSTYRNQSRSPARAPSSGQFGPQAPMSFSYANDPQNAIFQDDVTPPNAGRGSPRVLRQIIPSTGQERLVEQYPDGTNQWWLKERNGSLRNLGTTTGTASTITQGPVYPERDGTYVDVTADMKRAGYDMTNLRTAMIVGPNGTVYRDYPVGPDGKLDFARAKDYLRDSSGEFTRLMNGSPVTNAMAEQDKLEPAGTNVFYRDWRAVAAANQNGTDVLNPETADAVNPEVNYGQFNNGTETLNADTADAVNPEVNYGQFNNGTETLNADTADAVNPEVLATYDQIDLLNSSVGS